MMLTLSLMMVLGCDSSDAPQTKTPATKTPATKPEPSNSTVSTAGSTDKPSRPAANNGGGGGGLPNVGSNLAHGRCANGPGAEGADSYFVGDFKFNGDQVTGTERWQLFANPKWKARGGRDCAIEWTITGSKVGKGACSQCDMGVRFHAVADVTGSNCPEELVKGRELPNGRRVGGEANDFDQTYALERRGDGSVRVYFAKSGKLLAEGYHNGGGFNYVTSHACKWF